MMAGWRGVYADLQRAASSGGRRQLGAFCIEGLRLHERALRAGVVVGSCLVSRSFAKQTSPRVVNLIAELRRRGCQLHEVADDVLVELTGGRDVGHVVGLVDEAQVARPWSRLLDIGASGTVLALLDVDDPGNTGALVRTALAAGAAGLVAVGHCDPFHPRAVQTSMGSLFKLPLLRAADWREVQDRFQEAGFCSVVTLARGGTELSQASWSAPRKLVWVGSEAFGLPPEVSDAADHRVTIPMGPGVDSFSVNAATAIVLYELAR